MDKREKQERAKGNAGPKIIHKPDPRSLKDNPGGETICSPYFSNGCINEDTDTAALGHEEDENEKH